MQLPLKALIIAPFFWFYHTYILLVNMNEHSNMRHQRGRRPSFLSPSHYFLLQKCHDSSKNEFHCYLFLKDSPMIFLYKAPYIHFYMNVVFVVLVVLSTNKYYYYHLQIKFRWMHNLFFWNLCWNTMHEIYIVFEI